MMADETTIDAPEPDDEVLIDGEPAFLYDFPAYVMEPESRETTTVYTNDGTEIPNHIVGYREWGNAIDTKLFQIHAEDVEHAIRIFRTAPHPGHKSHGETAVVFVTPNVV